MAEITDDIKAAAAYIKRGGVVAFPTETVYGLGANVFDAEAVARIFAAKGRPPDNPLIVHVSDIDRIVDPKTKTPLVVDPDPNSKKLMATFFPGPLTLVLKKAAGVPDIVTAGLDTIAVRMPSNETARGFIAECGVPIAAPSANLSGRPSPTTWQAVDEDLGERIDCILRGRSAEIGLESTVVDCSGGVPLVLRSGAVSLEMLRQIVPETQVFLAGADEAPKSPGMRHKHYSPNARVVIYSGQNRADPAPRSAFIGLREPSLSFDIVEICPTPVAYAARLFAFFRECDRSGIEIIYCEPVEETGIGTALMDRIRRAGEE